MMALPLEKQQKGIPAKFEQAGSEGIRFAEEMLEGAADDLGHLFRADLAVPGKTLGHFREPGDVDEHHRTINGTMEAAGRHFVPLSDQAGKILVEMSSRHGRSLYRSFGRSSWRMAELGRTYHGPVSSSSYSGPVRILDTNGVLLTIGTVDATPDDGLGSWNGTLEVVSGTGVAGKALVVDLVAEHGRGRVQLVPIDNNGIMAHSRVVGLGPFPF